MNKAVIIVAGGSGSRMGGSIPKQFHLLNDIPILMHTMRRFFDYDDSLPIHLILPETEISSWQSLVDKYSFEIKHEVASGGITRQHSVLNGLERLSREAVVAIHDGVRPLCSPLLIRRCFDTAEKFSNAIPAIKVTDSIRFTDEENSIALDREKVRLIQTPQCFDSVKLKRAYSKISESIFTDDAAVFEKDNHKIHLIDGETSNIKITLPADLELASYLEKKLFGS